MLRKNIENFFAIIYEANSSANLNDSGSFDLDIYFLEIILGFILTVSIYTLPLVIYRFGIRKRPLTEYRAKRVTIVYAIIAFFVMTIIKGGATIPVLLLWSFLNYRLLIKKTKNDIDLKYDPKSKKSLKKW
ncbi:MAG: hypothetical protein II317_06175 [Clostridia bacterium]|nr:hypothetical protein [Clostridia bacterium]